MDRFYFPGSLESGQIELTGDEANHLTRVLRLSKGDRVEVFDGRGAAVQAEVAATGKRSASLTIDSVPVATLARSPCITLLTAAPKGDRLRFLVEKATELGVERLTLLETQHSVVHPGGNKLEKLKAAVIAACKQSGRNDLMTIDPPQPWAQAAELAAASGDTFLIAVPEVSPISAVVAGLGRIQRASIAIGPEGGWAADELRKPNLSGALQVGLGASILRIETAAIAVVSALRFGFCDTL